MCDTRLWVSVYFTLGASVLHNQQARFFHWQQIPPTPGTEPTSHHLFSIFPFCLLLPLKPTTLRPSGCPSVLLRSHLSNITPTLSSNLHTHTQSIPLSPPLSFSTVSSIWMRITELYAWLQRVWFWPGMRSSSRGLMLRVSFWFKGFLFFSFFLFTEWSSGHFSELANESSSPQLRGRLWWGQKALCSQQLQCLYFSVNQVSEAELFLNTLNIKKEKYSLALFELRLQKLPTISI